MYSLNYYIIRQFWECCTKDFQVLYTSLMVSSSNIFFCLSLIVWGVTQEPFPVHHSQWPFPFTLLNNPCIDQFYIPDVSLPICSLWYINIKKFFAVLHTLFILMSIYFSYECIIIRAVRNACHRIRTIFPCGLLNIRNIKKRLQITDRF
jgi:hypothetical protein